MATLSKAGRKAIPTKDFAGPDKSFPIENKAHARAALMDAPLSERKGNITKAQKDKIDAKARKELKKK